MRRVGSTILWASIAIAGAAAFARLALSRGETISAAWLLTAALATYAVAYRFYSRFIAARVFALDDSRPTPAHRLADGQDYVPTNRWIAFGHHFAAIAGPGPLVGPTLAAQFGYLPSALWIIIGVVLGGAVQDFVILCASMRRDGKSLGQMAAEEIGPVAGNVALLAILGIMIVLISGLALVVVNALKASPWGASQLASRFRSRYSWACTSDSSGLTAYSRPVRLESRCSCLHYSRDDGSHSRLRSRATSRSVQPHLRFA